MCMLHKVLMFIRVATGANAKQGSEHMKERQLQNHHLLGEGCCTTMPSKHLLSNFATPITITLNGEQRKCGNVYVALKLLHTFSLIMDKWKEMLQAYEEHN